jgi:hypothetical protein
VAYAYVNADGHIGPLAAAKDDVSGAAFRTAMMLAFEAGAAQVSAFIPGPNQHCMAVAAQHPMRLMLPMVLLSSREFGDWRRYCPRNPGFM